MKKRLPLRGLRRPWGSKHYIGKTQFDYIVEVASDEIVRNLNPDFEALCRVPTRGVIVTSRVDSDEFDFASRFFCPILGIDEDPVTASALLPRTLLGKEIE